MNLKEKCSFNPIDKEDITNLQEDIDTILSNCKSNKLSSDKFIKKVYNYLEKRPNIKNMLNKSKEIPLKKFAKQIAALHIRSHTLYRVLSGDEKNKEVIDRFKDEVKMFKEWTKEKISNADTSELTIEPRITGGKVYNSLDKQIKETNEVINNMIKQTNMAQA